MNRSSVAPPLVKPAYRTVPRYRRTLGPEVADLARLAGYAPDPEQEMVLDALFALRPDGRSAAFEVAVICSRQNLKTGVAKMAAMGWLVLTGERLIVWSAHEFRTAQEAFRDLEELLCGSDVLRRQVAKVSRADGDESIITTSGSRLIFKTRTKGGGRGLTGDKVILDEGFALRPMHMGALLPTLSARPDPQVMYCSSAGLPDSDVLRGIRDRGRPGDDRLAYFEWCAPPASEACAYGDACLHALTAEGCGCDKPALWQRSNPAMGRRITAEYIAGERRALPPAEFARERMGWWDDPAGGISPISYDQWEACADRKSQPRDPVALAFAIARDRSMSAIAVAGRREDGLWHGEVAEHQPGTGWLLQRVLDMAGKHSPVVVTFDPAGPAGSLEKDLRDHGYVTRPVPEPGKPLSLKPGESLMQLASTRDYAQACAALADDVVNDRWRHRSQRELGDAVRGVRPRMLADAWAWSRGTSAADITPLEAVTLARLGYATYGQGPGSPEPFAIWG